MKISMILAWAAVVCVLLTAARYLARISKNPTCNRLFHKLHIPTGLLALGFGLLHGLLAGNFPGGSLLLGPMLLTLNWGSACFVLMLLLLLSYLLKKQLKRAWMPAHRVLTLLLLAALAMHLWDVGIHVLDKTPAPTTAVSVSVTPRHTSTPTPQTPAPSAAESLAEASPEASASAEDVPAPADTPSPSPEPTPEPTPTVEFSGAVLADGVYQGSAQGYKSTITVEVTVEQGAVTAIQVLEQNDTPNYYAYAASIPDTVVENQSLEVDAVTGATYSSAGLLNAIEDALSGAVLEGELQVNAAIDALPAKGGRGKH